MLANVITYRNEIKYRVMVEFECDVCKYWENSKELRGYTRKINQFTKVIGNNH